jgi:SPP1 gp7 family putative phage head morphogenesis protein
MADQGIVYRVLAAAKYAFTGNAPTDWFGPGNPLIPMAPEEVKGRQWDYPVAGNINFQPRAGELVGFPKLKALADNCNTVRIVIEGQKDKLEALEWAIKPREKKGAKAEDAGAAEIQKQLEYPDGRLDWSQWLRALLEQVFVIDALSIYRQKTLGGDPFAFELLDGATIKVLLDQSGRRPLSPAPAYQQVLKGIPAVNYTREELLYYPQNVRADKAYGYSRVEQIIDTVETSIQRLKHQKAFFTHGNLSDGFFEAPAGTTPDQVRQVEAHWNALLGQGTVESRRQNLFLPGGFKWNAIGAPPLQDTFDEWLIRLICFTFSTSPQPFLKQAGLGHGGQETQHEAAEAAGLLNLMSYVRRVMNRLIKEDFQRPDLEFSWVEDREFEPKEKAEIEDKRLRNGSLTLDEVRDRNGEDPLPDGSGKEPMVYTATGPVLLKDVINPPEPPEPVVPPAPAPTDAPVSDLAKAASKAATEKALSRLLTRYLKGKGGEIAAALGDALGLAKAAGPADDGSNSDFSGRIDEALNDVDWDWTDLVKQVEPKLAGIAVAAGKDAVSELGLFDKTVLAKMTAAAEAFAETRAAEMVGRKLVDGELVENEGWSISAATRDMIRSAVADAMESGASNQELAKAVRESDAFSAARATTIARTETAKADIEGKRTGWKASGLVAGRQWLASEGCCDECQDLDGTIVGIDEDYPAGASQPLHPNCECDEVAVLPEEMPEEEGDGGEE